ncbi:30S ribosomal protein S13 [Candidatus Bathyarchaeota archaeon]|nr:30S ribosomal protein S13 [Candidatus Bathyarchaeota archaeon]
MNSLQEYRYIVRIAGVDLDGTMRIDYGLSKIKGIGVRVGRVLLRMLRIDPTKRIGYVSDEGVHRIETALKNLPAHGLPGWMCNHPKDLQMGMDLHLIGPDLELQTKADIDNMKKIRSWRGVMHSLGLKVQGQRTRTTGGTGRAVGVKKKRIEGR